MRTATKTANHLAKPTTSDKTITRTHSMAALRPPTRVVTSSNAMGAAPSGALRDRLPRAAAPAGDDLVATQPVVDDRRRVGLGKVVRGLGWHPGDEIEARIRGSRVVATRAVDALRPGLCVPLTVDRQCRLTLSPAICHALGLRPGTQIQAVADLRSGELTLLSLHAALTALLKENAG